MVSKGLNLLFSLYFFFFLQTVTGIGATSFQSYTNAINEIMERISEIPRNQSSDCCGYRNQILDKFCAVQVEREREREREIISVCV